MLICLFSEEMHVLHLRRDLAEHMNAKRQETGALLKGWLNQRRHYPIPSRPGKTNVQVNSEESKRQVADMIRTRPTEISIARAKALYNRAISTFEREHHTDPSQLVAMSDINTIVDLPAARITRKFPRYIEHFYSAMDRPLAALYGAVLACCYQFGRIPDALFVTEGVISAIAEDTQILTGKKYDGCFRIFYPGAIDGRTKIFQVFTEEQLPGFILNHYDGVLPWDRIIAICEE